MKKILFALPGNERLSSNLAKLINAEQGKLKIHLFPDGEKLIQYFGVVEAKEIILICSLNQPDTKLLPLYFLAKELRSCGAAKITLVSPYLAYMRQDKLFHAGEIISSKYFAILISDLFDEFVTIDPHLHRWKNLSDIYSIPCQLFHASGSIAAFIKNNIHRPILFGPDSESTQWVSEVAKQAGAPFLILNKLRHGDKDVEVSLPEVEKYLEYTPVLIDDIISTGHTMIETVNRLKKAGMKPVSCIGVHAIFAGNAYEELLQTGAEIITCNTIEHDSNKIDITQLVARAFPG